MFLFIGHQYLIWYIIYIYMYMFRCKITYIIYICSVHICNSLSFLLWVQNSRLRLHFPNLPSSIGAPWTFGHTISTAVDQRTFRRRHVGTMWSLVMVWRAIHGWCKKKYYIYIYILLLYIDLFLNIYIYIYSIYII